MSNSPAPSVASLLVDWIEICSEFDELPDLYPVATNPVVRQQFDLLDNARVELYTKRLMKIERQLASTSATSIDEVIGLARILVIKQDQKLGLVWNSGLPGDRTRAIMRNIERSLTQIGHANGGGGPAGPRPPSSSGSHQVSQH